MFTDRAHIYVKSGKGGAGCSSFLREKFRPMGGPDGGDGGKGGNVYIVGRKKLNSLAFFRHQRKFYAQNGEPGKGKCQFGRDGEDLYIEVPCGTLVINSQTEELLYDIVEPDKAILLARGGLGGKGNVHFATARKQSPTYAQKGLPGEEFEINLELKLIADIGLVGMPNAGKSTLLKALTRANPKIAAYPFTTLAPNLGVLKIYDKEFVIADIPGLIEGASQGVGLGDDFLRHVERTKYLMHIIDVSGFSGDPLVNYEVIMQELKLYSAKLAAKKQIIVLNKIDVPESAEYIKKIKKELKKKNIFEISAVTGAGKDQLLQEINKLGD